MKNMDTSLDLYNFLCRRIVGSEEAMKLKRLVNAAKDKISSKSNLIQITSGSFGEGLEMRSSDVDLMFVMSELKVYEDMKLTHINPKETYFIMDIDYLIPGFTYLRLVYCRHAAIPELCTKEGHDLYLNGLLIKHRYGLKHGMWQIGTVHGPCVSDPNGLFDYAFCLPSTAWISPARHWITRPNNSWPSEQLKSHIIKHGVLFVPIGLKGSKKENLQWRISFSVGEKLLIYSFSHTQMICYALLKILLKDVINKDIRCNGLLCSYFLKTIMFWTSEEAHMTDWKPNNLINCFLICFRRLIYCVQYSVCPHYFIPENNLFESKIEGVNQEILHSNLNMLYKSYGWRSILLSTQLSGFQEHSNIGYNVVTFVDNIQNLLFSHVLTTLNVRHKRLTSIKAVHYMMNSSSSNVRSIYRFLLSLTCNHLPQFVPNPATSTNRLEYQWYHTCQYFLLLNIKHDAISGWLMLASFFYRLKQYRICQRILTYTMWKNTADKVQRRMRLLAIHRKVLSLNVFTQIGFIKTLKIQCLDSVIFDVRSSLIPKEIQAEVVKVLQRIPPIVYLHFLRFLCHYHLCEVQHCQNALRDLQFSVEDGIFSFTTDRRVSYNCLSIILELVGDHDAARCAFNEVAFMKRLEKTNI